MTSSTLNFVLFVVTISIVCSIAESIDSMQMYDIDSYENAPDYRRSKVDKLKYFGGIGKRENIQDIYESKRMDKMKYFGGLGKRMNDLDDLNKRMDKLKYFGGLGKRNYYLNNDSQEKNDIKQLKRSMDKMKYFGGLGKRMDKMKYFGGLGKRSESETKESKDDLIRDLVMRYLN